MSASHIGKVRQPASSLPAASVPPAALPRFWLLVPLACLALAAVVFAGTALGWILRHPEIGGWDQIGYADEARQDLLALTQGGWGALRDSLFLEARFHPPGVRLLALPLGLLGFADLTSLRLLAFGASVLTALLVGLTARFAAGTGAGMLAASGFLLAPVTLFSAEEFLSETLLLPALAGLLWCLAREVRGGAGWGNAALLGACLGAGALARLSFLPQVAPVLALAGLLVLRFDPARLGRLALAGFVGSLIAWPFYALNVGRYVGYAHFALADWHTHELRRDGPLGYLGNWLWFVADWAFGPFLMLALVLGLVALGYAGWRARQEAGGTLRPERWPASLAIAAAALLLAAPPIAGHFLATNHNPRFLLAALPGLAVAMAIGLRSLPWRSSLAAGAGLLAAQAVALAAVGVWPAAPPFAGLTSMQSRPPLACDWRPVVGRLIEARPRLLLLGLHDGFNDVQVAYAFHRLDREVSVEALRSDTEWPVLAEAAGRAQAVLALEAADPSDIPYYRESFRWVPEAATHRLDFIPASLVDRLMADGGFAAREEILAPGPGACRAWLLTR